MTCWSATRTSGTHGWVAFWHCPSTFLVSVSHLSFVTSHLPGIPFPLLHAKLYSSSVERCVRFHSLIATEECLSCLYSTCWGIGQGLCPSICSFHDLSCILGYRFKVNGVSSRGKQSYIHYSLAAGWPLLAMQLRSMLYHLCAGISSWHTSH